MLGRLVEQIEHVLLRMESRRSIPFLNLTPSWAVEALQRTRFRRTLRLAAERSQFYREEFKRRAIDISRVEHPAELGDFYTTGEDLRLHGPEAFLTGTPHTVFETTGTTSAVPKQVFFSQRETDDMGRCNAVVLSLLGLRAEDRVLSAFDSSFWVSPAVLRSGLRYLKCFHAEAGKIPPPEFYERASAYRPNVIFGEPSWMVRMSELAQKRGTWPVKFLFAGGENISEEARQVVEDIWGAPLYLNYGQTESFGALGAECVRKDGYHRNDLFFLFETPEVDTGGYGELVYTTLVRDVMPLIRYRSADVTRLVDDPCPCGFFPKRIAKVRARCDEMLVCGMGNIGPWIFDELLLGLNGSANEWQVVVKHQGQLDVVELHVETNGAHGTDLQTAVLTRLRNRFSDFWKNYEMKLYDLRIVPQAPGTLRTDRKLRRLVDERRMVKSGAVS